MKTTMGVSVNAKRMQSNQSIKRPWNNTLQNNTQQWKTYLCVPLLLTNHHYTEAPYFEYYQYSSKDHEYIKLYATMTSQKSFTTVNNKAWIVKVRNPLQHIWCTWWWRISCWGMMNSLALIISLTTSKVQDPTNCLLWGLLSNQLTLMAPVSHHGSNDEDTECHDLKNFQELTPNPRAIKREWSTPKFLVLQNSQLFPKGPKRIIFCYNLSQVHSDLSCIPLVCIFN